MGAYLAKPVFEPETVAESGRGMAFGASSVQGWRMSQEDAHNCILDFDDDCSLFAVYDGHGGNEVSKYCSLYLPKFIKKLSSYQAGDCKEALIDAFVKFDQTLTKPEVVEVLKQLSQDMTDSEGCEDSEEDERDALAREAQMPLDELMSSYKSKKEQESAKQEEQSEKKNGECKKKEDAGKDGDDSKEEGSSASTASKDAPGGDAGQSEAVEPASSGGSSGSSSNGDKKAHEGSSSSEAAGSSSGAGGSSTSASSLTALTSSFPERAARKRAVQKLRAKIADADDEDDDEDYNGDHDNGDNDREDDEAEDEDQDDDDESDENEYSDSDSEDDSEDDEADGDCDNVEMFNSDVPGCGSGTTAVVAIIKGDVLTVANAGDSRAVLCRDGKAMDLSVDHKPEDALERERIERAGGKVTSDGRVNGGLNLSRAIGDHVYKLNEDLPLQEQMISPLPDVQSVLLDRSKDNFLVLACDGIWNCMTSQEVCDFVAACLRAGDHVGKICEQLFRKCLAPDTSGDGTGCDNMTCIIVRLNTESQQDKPGGGEQPAGQCNGSGNGVKRCAEEDSASKKARVSS